jgi:hypothetical protein
MNDNYTKIVKVLKRFFLEKVLDKSWAPTIKHDRYEVVSLEC